MSPTRTQRTLGWVTIALLVVLVAGIIVLRVSVTDLNTDDQLINRGQESNNCIGDRADYIDDWRAIFLGIQSRQQAVQSQQQQEFLAQVQRVQDGVPIVLRRAERLAHRAERLADRGFRVERKIRLLVQEKRDIRDQSRALIADNDPDALFVCDEVAADLIPPPLP